MTSITIAAVVLVLGLIGCAYFLIDKCGKREPPEPDPDIIDRDYYDSLK